MKKQPPNLFHKISKVKHRKQKVVNYTRSNVKKNLSSFYESFGFVLVLGQYFSLMPISGVRGTDPYQIRFRWFSFRIVYTLFVVAGCLFSIVLQFMHFWYYGRQLGDIVGIIFFLSSAVSSLIFIKLSYIWFDFSQQWLIIERAMGAYHFEPNLVRRIKITTCIVMILALVEHLLSVVNAIQHSNKCPIAQSDPIKSYYAYNFAHIFMFIEFNYWIALYMQITSILATFVWSYTDLFVILMCAALAERFRQLNRRVRNEQDKNYNFWKDIRENYARLSMLCKNIDNAISHIVTLSLANDLFFICIQLFNTLKPIKGFINTIYFLYSFGFLLGRTAALSVYCCWINDESKIILSYLFVVPSEHFGIETNRLIQQICYCPVVITGSNYFDVTKGLCLQIAGAIITFELILLQLGPKLLKTDQEFVQFCIT